MKVYIATSGSYSDYCVRDVFTTYEDAAAHPQGDDVLEMEVREGPIDMRPWHVLVWWPDHEPRERSEPREFDGNPHLCQHTWRTSTELKGGAGWVTRDWLAVEGWDLERVRKVYSEQRAQHIARQDMGVEQRAE